MTNDERQALKALAEQATPGPWQWVDDELHGGVDPVCRCDEQSHFGAPIIQTDSGYYGPCAPDRAFIAAANPQAVLALLAEPGTERIDDLLRRLDAIASTHWRIDDLNALPLHDEARTQVLRETVRAWVRGE